ncbi:MAG: PKD domain-containing protein [Solirubrobacteraceae bacterium]
MRGLMWLVVLGAGLALAGPASAAEQTIAFANYAYNPTPATIKTGDTATFSGSFSSHPLVWDANNFATTNTGSSKSFSFSQPGTYFYHCQIHAQTQGMVGQITVVANQHPAVVSFGVSPSPRAGQPVTFTYTGSDDPDGTLTSWQWDLDGDGTFETTTLAGTVANTYASPGTVNVHMRAVDDSGEPSAVATQAVTIAAGGSGGSGSPGSPGSGASGTKDTTAPKATLVRLAGLKLTFRSSERASATATLRARGRTIAKGSAKAKSGAISLRLHLTSAGRSMVAGAHKLKATLTLTLRDASGNRRALKKTLTVRRP